MMRPPIFLTPLLWITLLFSCSQISPALAEGKQPGNPLILGAPADISRVKRSIAAPAAAQDRGKTIRLPRINREVSARSIMLMDAENGATLFSREPDQPRQPASTIKVLTGMIALKSLHTQEMVPVSDRAAGMPSSKIYLDPQKQYQANDLVNAVLLASANDASVALAEKIAGSEEAFAELMTLRARLWGASNTICRTASGLTAKGQQSTARDLAVIFRHAMQDPDFAARMRQRRATTSDGTTLYNHNKALWRVQGAMAGKTGYTAVARQTYVGQFERDGATVIVAILGSETMWDDVQRLVEYGFKKKQIELAALQPRTGQKDSDS